MRQLLDERDTEPEDDSRPIVDVLRETYGSNVDIARAAGYVTAAEAVAAHRARYPKARKTTLARIAEDARRNRRTFLRGLQKRKGRYAVPKRLAPVLEELRDLSVAVDEAQTLEDLAEALVRAGVTFIAGYSMLLVVSKDSRWRYNLPTVSFWPPALFATRVGARQWELAADVFFEAWGQAYGIGVGVSVEEVEDLELAAGIVPSALGTRYGAVA